MAKKRFKTALALLLAGAACLGLTGCGDREESQAFTKDDAILYIDGMMKETYLGVFEPDYLTLVGLTEDEARETYEDGLAYEAQRFIYYLYGIEYPTEDYYHRVQELYAEIYSHTRYEVVSAAQQDDGSFSVKLTIEPIDVALLANDLAEEAVAAFHEKYPSEVVNAMSEEEYQAMDEDWAEMVLELFQTVLPQLGHEAPQSLSVQLEVDEEGYYYLPDEDFSRIDEMIIDYYGDWA